MQFVKDGDVYKVARMTGSQDNILGISFSEHEVNVDVVEWDVKQGAIVKSSSSQVLEQVLSGLKLVNDDLGKKYHLSKIFFLPSDNASNSVYEFLLQELVKRYDSKLCFKQLD
ncbi:MAG: hypothetical protein ACR2PX_00120 [Endozoicomonas sp.]|uniref:hypothetical protein n=1 Tax=Endozoicomonas sp. TaxID=1892382 RepID=UPI003D9AD719